MSGLTDNQTTQFLGMLRATKQFTNTKGNNYTSHDNTAEKYLPPISYRLSRGESRLFLQQIPENACLQSPNL